VHFRRKIAKHRASACRPPALADSHKHFGLLGIKASHAHKTIIQKSVLFTKNIPQGLSALSGAEALPKTR
jgi:hypothetical protein